MNEHSDPDDAGGQGEKPRDSRSDLALFRAALRQDWAIPEAIKRQLLQRAIGYCDPETAEGSGASARTVIAALKVIAQFCHLTIKQQAVDLHRERLELATKGDGSLTLADLVAEAEKANDAYEAPAKP